MNFPSQIGTLVDTADLLRNEVLPDIFGATVARQPHHTAIISGSETLSYAEVDERSNIVANALRARSIGPGSFVGLWMARGADLLVTMLAILKAGAAYVPFDADAPPARVADCLEDCQAAALVVDREVACDFARPVFTSQELRHSRHEDPHSPQTAPQQHDQAAYLIYTSGSTGKPKGVVISHASVCHFLRSANTVYQLTADDVVFQGASVAFDLSVEEIWIPWMVGATLWVAGAETLQSLDNLAGVLTRAGVTVIDTVPTLLALVTDDVPTLRTIILGGEACPPDLAARWCQPGRRLFNSYGPTEATVVATIAEVQPGVPITIGHPIPNYTCYVVDEAMQPVEEGELLLGGPGIAGQYLNRPDLSREKFIPNPFHPEGPDPVLYRTGDKVCQQPDGSLAFRGRLDDQVKIRGFRIELGEIESRLTQCTGVRQASVIATHHGEALSLIAFLVVEAGTEVDRRALRVLLRGQMPIYMVPAHFEVVAELPRLASGKVDRKALQRMAPVTTAPEEEQDEPQTPTEAVLLAAAQRALPGQGLPLEADLFLDLGFHSLLAARFVSFVRETPSLANLTMTDIYAQRSLRALASLLDERARTAPAARSLSFSPPPLMRRFLCGLAQLAALPFILALTIFPWLGSVVVYELFTGEVENVLVELLALLLTYALIYLGSAVLAIAAKWLILGRTRPGRYPLWGAYYYRWWLTDQLISLVHLRWFQGTPLMRGFLRLLGARVGSDTFIGNLEAGAFDLVHIGARASIGARVFVANAEVVGDELILGAVEFGDDCHIGTSCTIGSGSALAQGTDLADLTSLPPGTVTGAWETWQGSPGRCTGRLDPQSLPAQAEASAVRKNLLVLIYMGALLLLPPISLAPVIPAFFMLDKLTDWIDTSLSTNYLYFVPILAVPLAMMMVALTVLLMVAVRWVVLPRLSAGTYSIYSGVYVRKWIVALATELTLDTLSALYATVYMPAWYRLMGANVGRDAEISTSLEGRYDLTDIGEKCFIADDVVLGDEDVRGGWMTLAPVKTAARVFVGNDAVVPPGAVLPEGSLIGVKSLAPSCNDAMQAGDTWFGSPAIKLPVRQRFDDVQAAWTYEPTRRRRIGRAVFEALRIALPTVLMITLGMLAVEIVADSINDEEYLHATLYFLGIGVSMSVILTLVAAAVKWLTMGVYRPTAKPMWSWWALRTETVAVLYSGLAAQMLLEQLRGTPMLPWVLRLFGCRFGQGVYMGSTDITEFDCVDIGDHCAINRRVTLQTHLYEDRVMKVGRIKLGTGVTIGSGSTVLYDTKVGDFAQLGLLTIVMKGEEIPAGTEWQGAPAVMLQGTGKT